jgi:aminodeoxyfutalosine deaminase
VSDDETVNEPKIELHVHLEGTVGPETLLELGRKNGVPLPVETVEELRELYRFKDFDHFIQTWLLVTVVLRTADDFRRITVEYAAEAKAQGCVYIEGIFSPTQQFRRGIDLDEVFTGYCDGVQEARERHGVEVRLTPDLTRGGTPEESERAVRYSIKYHERGVVGVGLGGYERDYPPDLYVDAFRLAREHGLGSVPHAGEVVGPESVRGAIDLLHADRLRHGITSVRDPALVREIADRGIVLDTCLVSNVCVGIVPSLAEHPLPKLVAAGVLCSLSSDDPAMFDTSLQREYDEAAMLGLDSRGFYDAGVAGALCDETTRARLREIGASYWGEAASSSSAATARS